MSSARDARAAAAAPGNVTVHDAADQAASAQVHGQAATEGEVAAAAVMSGVRKRGPLTLTALFANPEAVDATLDALYSAGIPRDLIEVVVSREAAQRFYAGGRRAARPPGREVFRWAGIGALVGFLGGSAISLVMVAWPGLDAPGGMQIVQLFGPNVGITAGSALGAILGFFRRQKPDARHARAAEASGQIVMAVQTRGEREARALATLLEVQGGRDVRLE